MPDEKTKYTNNMSLPDKPEIYENGTWKPLKREEGIFIGRLRKAFDLKYVDLDLFDEVFLRRYSCMIKPSAIPGPFRGRPYSKNDWYVMLTVRNIVLSMTAHGISYIIDLLEKMEFEAGSKLGYLPDHYGSVSDYARRLSAEKNVIDLHDKAKDLIAAAVDLIEKHIFDLTYVNKNESVIYLYSNGYEFREVVEGLQRWDYARIIKGYERENNNAGNDATELTSEEEIKKKEIERRELIRSKEAREILKINRNTLLKLVRNGYLIKYGIRGMSRYDKKEVLNLISQNK